LPSTPSDPDPPADSRPASESVAPPLPPALAVLSWWHWLLLGILWFGAFVARCAAPGAGSWSEALGCGVLSAVVSGACFGSVALLAVFFVRGIRRTQGR
jgi:hypothetical protein